MVHPNYHPRERARSAIARIRTWRTCPDELQRRDGEERNAAFLREALAQRHDPFWADAYETKGFGIEYAPNDHDSSGRMFVDEDDAEIDAAYDASPKTLEDA